MAQEPGANAAGRNVRACIARESKREESSSVGGRAMRLMDGRGVGECWSGFFSCVARMLCFQLNQVLG
jgi:hypothetical protein